jgi:hypothetical protein
MSYYDRKPGYYKDEVRQALKRLTDREFLGKLCTHTAKRRRERDACCGWNRQGWSLHEAWKRGVA